MRVTKLLGVIACITAGLMVGSCGKKSQQTDEDGDVKITVKPASTSVTGPLGAYFTVVDKDYTTEINELMGGVLTVELKRNAEPIEMPWPSELDVYSFSTVTSSRHVQVGFGIELLDAEGHIVGKTSPSTGGLGGPYNSDECVALVKLNPGEVGSIRFSLDKEAETAVSFRISSDYQVGGSDSYTGDDELSGSGSDGSLDFNEESYEMSDNTSDSADWNEILDAYEYFIDQYVPFCKKVADKQISVTDPEYSEMMQKAAEFSSKMMNADPDDMTPAQYARLTKLVRKANAAAAKMR